MRATVLTSIMDDYDTLKPTLPQRGADVDWVCFTDSRQLLAEVEENSPPLGAVKDRLIHPTGWRIVHYNRPADQHPNRKAKLPKTHPRLFSDARATVWLDASFRVVSPRFVADVVDRAAAGPSGLAQFRHPWRDCLFTEAQVSLTLPKYGMEADAIHHQVRAYDDAGMPRNWGLWATGVIARIHGPETFGHGVDWAHEIERHSYQDQISHPYVCWQREMRPVDLPGTHLGNEWLAYEGSGRH